MVADTSLLLNQALDARQDGAARGRARPRCSTSTTAPTRSSPSSQPDRRRRLHRLRHRPPTRIDRVIGDRSRPTRPGSARARSRPSCSTTTASSLRKIGGEFGVTTGRDAPLRLVRRRRRPLRRPGQRRSPTSSSPSSTCSSGLGADPGLRGLRRRRRAARRDADDPDRVPPRQAGLRVPRRLVGGHLRLPRPSTTCRRTRRPTCSALEELSGARIWAIGVGPGRDETVVIHDLID